MESTKPSLGTLVPEESPSEGTIVAFIEKAAQELEEREPHSRLVRLAFRLLRIHNTHANLHRGSDGDMSCIGCGLNPLGERATTHVNDCPTLMVLAGAFSGHPEYGMWARVSA